MINIASTTDGDFTDVLMTFYVSILENNLDNTFQFFIIDDKLSESDKSYIRQLQEIYSNIKKITFIKIDTQFYKEASTDSPVSAIKENTYYKVELPLHVNCSRLLYLDCDMICKGNLADLWKTDLQGNVIGAIEDQGFDLTKKGLNDKHITRYIKRYFNGGLILFDIKKWNKEHVTEKTHEFVKQHGSDLDFQEQDALNAVLNGKWKLLDPRYNVQTYLARKEKTNPDPYQEKLGQKAQKSPVIIHYTTWSKPWVRNGKSVHPWRDQYYYYKYIFTRRLQNNEKV